MKYVLTAILVLGVVVSNLSAQIPKVGSDTLLEIGTWNTEWFGSTENGPTNEATQYANIKSVLEQTDVDIWGLEEVSDPQVWNQLVAEISPKYLSYIATYDQQQKTAVLYDKNKFKIINSLSGHVLTGSEFAYNFSSRPPLRVALQTKNRPVTDTLYVFVVHMKAYGDKESYERRVGASAQLQAYLEASYSGKRWVVCGDWNDDLYTSTYNNSTSPYVNLADTSKYVFISRELTDAGKRSYVFGSPGRMLDHILMSDKMKDWYMKGSARVLSELTGAISGYNNNTSDHYPVIGLFDNRVKLPEDTPTTGIREQHPVVNITCYPNPANDRVLIEADSRMEEVGLYQLSGGLVESASPQETRYEFRFSRALANGIYLLKVSTPQGISYAKVVIQH